MFHMFVVSSCLLAGYAAVEPECTITSTGRSSCPGSTAMLQVRAQRRMHILHEEPDAQMHSNIIETHALCECIRSEALRAATCDKCYKPSGASSCVLKDHSSIHCPGCTENLGAWHCPHGCLGPVCQGTPEPVPPVSSFCESANASEVTLPARTSFQGWYDVQGTGYCNDHCRWHGCNGEGPDPMKQLTYKGPSGCLAFWTCELSDNGQRETQCGHFKAPGLPFFNFPICSSKGSVALPRVQFNAYVPGYQGADWKYWEMLIVRAKVRQLFERGSDLMREAGIDGSKTLEGWWSVPNAAKVLRLGFHDCLRYSDGTGGCDGCLSWKGVGTRFPRNTLEKGLYTRGGDLHNNGLEFTVEVLERIYTDRAFPSGTPLLPVSLRDSGKSRADLWAFAVLDAVEYSIERNNVVCKDPEVFLGNQCHPRAGQPDCMVTMPRPFQFKTGRRDCATTFKTDREERSPDAESNGAGTVKFFQENFNFQSGEQVVAIMGGHTIGRPHVIHSLFRYTWKAYSETLFNNGYFRNLAKKEDWFMSSGNFSSCAERILGNASGHRPIARWSPHVRGDTKSGGPVQWIQEKFVCPNCKLGRTEDQDCCATAALSGKECRPECQSWRFVMGLDETALPCEIGLYYNFTVDDQGIPSGCPGLDSFNMTQWGGWVNDTGPGLKNYKFTWGSIDGKIADPQCSLNKQRVGDSRPLHEIIEEFAEDQSKFIAAFVPALEKMLDNGYGEKDNELKLAPEAGMKFKCSKEQATYRCDPS